MARLVAVGNCVNATKGPVFTVCARRHREERSRVTRLVRCRHRSRDRLLERCNALLIVVAVRTQMEKLLKVADALWRSRYPLRAVDAIATRRSREALRCLGGGERP